MASKDGVEGFNNLMSLAEALEFAARQTVDASAKALAGAAKALAPEGDSGELRDSIHVEDGDGPLDKYVVADSPHALFVEYGTGQRGAASDIERPDGIQYDSEWKGMVAEPFLTPAAERVNRDLAKAFEEIEKRLKGQGGQSE